jgi:hypothetical protein
MTVIIKIAVLTFLILATAGWGRGAYPAVWRIWPITLLLVPIDLFIYLGSLRLDVQLIISLIAVLALWLQGHRASEDHRFGFCLLDLLVGLMLLVKLISLAINREFGETSIPYAILGFFPYLIGRWYLRSSDDLPAAARSMALVITISAALMVVSALIHMNILNRLITNHKVYSTVRFGVMRAGGNTGNPVFQGMGLLLLLPWLWEASREARLGFLPPSWRFAPWIGAMGILSTMSRGSSAAILGALAVRKFFLNKAWRIPLLTVGIVGGLASWYYKDTVIDAAQRLINPAGYAGETKIITIDNQQYVYDGTRHRLLLYIVYAPALRQAGLFGLSGTWQTYLPPDLGNFWSQDNHYIHLRLKNGWAGLILFDLAMAVSLIYLARVAFTNQSLSHMAAGLFGCLGCNVFILFSAALGMENIFFFSLGLAATMKQINQIETLYPPAPAEDWAEDDEPEFYEEESVA